MNQEQKSKEMDEKADRPLVLIVEDDVEIRKYLATSLESYYQTEEAANGTMGWNKAFELIPDLMVIDVMMPGMNGIELCNKVKSHSETSHIPLIMLTAQVSEENQLKGLETGADDYVTKPFSMLLLKARIDNLLKARKTLQSYYKQQFLLGEKNYQMGHEGDRKFLEQINQLINDHFFDEKFTPERMAESFGMSLRSLQRKLKTLLDESPASYLSNFRMRRACELLENTPLSVKEIAFQVGVFSVSSFSRMFKHNFGANPSAYREAILKKKSED